MQSFAVQREKENAVVARRALRFGGKIILGGEDLNIFGGWHENLQERLKTQGRGMIKARIRPGGNRRSEFAENKWRGEP